MNSSKWSFASARSLEGVENLLARAGGVDAVQGEGRHAAQGHRRDRAEGANPDPGRAQQLGLAFRAQLAHRAVGENQLHRLYLRGDVAQLGPGAVGAGRDRAGDRLAIDVAEVLHRQTEPVQLLVELGKHRAAPDLDQAGSAVGVDHAAERAGVDHRAVGHRRLGERVAAAGDADLAPGRNRRTDRLGQLLAPARAHQLGRRAGLVPGPITPGLAGPPLLCSRRKPCSGSLARSALGGGSRRGARAWNE